MTSRTPEFIFTINKPGNVITTPIKRLIKSLKYLKNKNIKLLNNQPLILHTLITANKSKLFNKIVVSSDSNKILKITKSIIK